MDRDRTEPTVADPLGRIGGTLRSAARRQQAARRRRRRALVSAAAAVGLLTLTGGAMAVTGGSTGVAAIDRWLASTEEHQAADPAGGGWPAHDMSPVPDTLSAPFEVEIEGDAGAVAVGYRRGDGMLCAVLVDEAYRGDRPAGTTCLSRRLLVQGLEEGAARAVGGGGRKLADGSMATVVTGFARPDVRSLRVVDPDGEPADAVLSEPWEPYAPEPPRVRVFLVVMKGPLALGPEGPAWFHSDIEARLADGRTVSVGP